MNSKNEVLNWLRDAYAMERGLQTALKNISESDQHALQFRCAAAVHLEETRRHAHAVESLLHSLGAKPPAVKTGASMTTEMWRGLGTAMARDEQIKDLLGGNAMEHLEIACYRTLSAAAEMAGLPDVAETCAEIIPDEEKMAEAISNVLPDVVQEVLGAAAVTPAM